MAVLTGTPGNDLLQGSAENDRIVGLAGNDTLNAGTGSDYLDGGEGDDLLILGYVRGDDNDFVDGGQGIDTLILDLSLSNDSRGVTYDDDRFDIFSIPDAGVGAYNIEQYQLTGTFRDDLLRGGIGNDILNGGAGNDTLVSKGGVDVLNGGTDVDLAIVDFSTTFDAQVLTNQGVNRLTNGTTFIDIEALNLRTGSGNDGITLFGDYNDTLSTTAGDDNISSGGGNDIIDGGAGNDRLDGGTGNDRLTGGIGNDILNGGTGSDSLEGGEGDDLLILGYAPGDDNDFIDGGQGFDTLVVDLSSANDAEGIRYIDPRFFSLFTPDITINVSSIEQFNLTGTARNDVLVGAIGRDILDGGAGDDNLIGNEDSDRLLGGIGRDSLVGGAGDDTLIGGRGKDRYVYDTNIGFSLRTIGRDIIQGFTRRQDKIVLDKTTFTTLTSITEKLSQAEFATVKNNRQAAKSNALIIYNTRNGNLFYNANGSRSGFGEGGNFALLRGKPAITAADFSIQF